MLPVGPDLRSRRFENVYIECFDSRPILLVVIEDIDVWRRRDYEVDRVVRKGDAASIRVENSYDGTAIWKGNQKLANTTQRVDEPLNAQGAPCGVGQHQGGRDNGRDARVGVLPSDTGDILGPGFGRRDLWDLGPAVIQMLLNHLESGVTYRAALFSLKASQCVEAREDGSGRIYLRATRIELTPNALSKDGAAAEKRVEDVRIGIGISLEKGLDELR